MDFFIKYAWVVTLKVKKGTCFVNAFPKNLDSSNKKPNERWIYQVSEFYNYLFRRFFKNNRIEMYSTYIDGKSVLAERFIKTFLST